MQTILEYALFFDFIHNIELEIVFFAIFRIHFFIRRQQITLLQTHNCSKKKIVNTHNSNNNADSMQNIIMGKYL